MRAKPFSVVRETYKPTEEDDLNVAGGFKKLTESVRLRPATDE